MLKNDWTEKYGFILWIYLFIYVKLKTDICSESVVVVESLLNHYKLFYF